jgi:hypothetical protein
VESLSMAWLIARSFLVSALAVNVAAVFVLITVILASSSLFSCYRNRLIEGLLLTSVVNIGTN